jgi:hypothetical protein
MDMDSAVKFMQMFMGNNSRKSEKTDKSDKDENSGEKTDGESADFSKFFEGIDFDMVSKIGEMFSRMNKPDMNAELLMALRPHLRDENRHKIDNAVKLSKMIAMLPYLRESGIFNDLF